jgi:hypothetical protein
MALLPNPPVITANGDYTVSGMKPGFQYLLTVKGTWGGGTITLSTLNPALGTMQTVNGGTMTGSNDNEVNIVLDSTTLQISLAGATNPNLGIAIVPVSR